MTPDEARILELYRAFNGRDFDGFFGMLSPDVDWTNDTDDTRLIGRDALRAYILDETAPLRARFAPIHVQALDDSQVSVLTQQVIRSTADGTVWSDTWVRHTFRLEDNRVVRMDIQRDAPAGNTDFDLQLAALYDAIDRQHIDAVVGHFHPDARIPDSLEQATLTGLDAIRDYYLRQFAMIRLTTSLISTYRLPDGRIEAILHVLVRGLAGGFWWEGRLRATYLFDQGLIIETTIAEPPGN